MTITLSTVLATCQEENVKLKQDINLLIQKLIWAADRLESVGSTRIGLGEALSCSDDIKQFLTKL